jgi:hypothetical protein
MEEARSLVESGAWRGYSVHQVFLMRQHSLDGSGEIPNREEAAARRRRIEEREQAITSDPDTIPIHRQIPIVVTVQSLPPDEPQRRRRPRKPRFQPDEAELPWYHSNIIIIEAQIAEWRNLGTQYQRWISYQTKPGCPIKPSTLTWTDLINAPLVENRFAVSIDELRAPPKESVRMKGLGLSKRADWRFISIMQYTYSDSDSGRKTGTNIYAHRTGRGAIFVENIKRHCGPYWSQVAQAQYELDHDIDTLKYVFFINAKNVQTTPYVGHFLYPGHALAWSDSHRKRAWVYGTREYEELLGTKLGRCVARLVLGAWPRGTRRIEKIVTWIYGGELQMRFDIESI